MARLFILIGLVFCGCTVSQAAKEAALKEASVFDGLRLMSIDGRPLPEASYKDKVVLIVNVASQCGFTSQYGSLQRLYDRYKSRGLLVIGVPCNQFGQQEPGNEAEIAAFAKREYGVTFPLLKKQKVKGQMDPLFSRLMGTSVGRHAGVRWNFEKFLVNRRGQLVNRFTSLTKPTDLDLIREIEGALTTSQE